MSDNKKAYAYLLLTFFLWGGIYVCGKYSMDTIPAPAVAGLRYIIAIIPLYFFGRRQLPKIERSDWKYFFIIGTLGYFFSVFINMIGINIAGASVSATINAVNPVAISIIAALILKEKLGWTKILCLFLAIAGTLIISGTAVDSSQLEGIVLVLISVLCWSLATVYMRKMSQKYNSIAVNVYGIAISLLFHIPASVISVVQSGGFHPDTGAGLAVLYMALGGTALAQFLWSKSLSILEASTCSLFYPLQPLFSMLQGALILNEKFTPGFFIGAALIIADVLINCLSQIKKPAG